MNDPLRQHHFLFMEMKFRVRFRGLFSSYQIFGNPRRRNSDLQRPNPPQLSGFLVPARSSARQFPKCVYQSSQAISIIPLYVSPPWRHLRATPIITFVMIHAHIRWANETANIAKIVNTVAWKAASIDDHWIKLDLSFFPHSSSLFSIHQKQSSPVSIHQIFAAFMSSSIDEVSRTPRGTPKDASWEEEQWVFNWNRQNRRKMSKGCLPHFFISSLCRALLENALVLLWEDAR